MEAKLIIPVIDTESGNFDTDIKLAREEYIDMVNDNFIKNDKAINHYMTHEWGMQKRQNFANEVSNKPQVEVEFNEIESKCEFLTIKNADFNEDKLKEYIESGKMFLILLNLNPNGADLDALSELRFWLDDSQRVLNDETLDDMAKIKYLPKRELAIKIEEETYTKRYNLKNCKMIENRSNEKAPYLFVLMIEKIIEG